MSDTEAETDADVIARALEVLKGRRETLRQELNQASKEVELTQACLDEIDNGIDLLERGGHRKPGRKRGSKNAEKPPSIRGTQLEKMLRDSLAQTESPPDNRPNLHSDDAA